MKKLFYKSILNMYIFEQYNGDIFESAFDHDNKDGFGITKYGRFLNI